jgi:hypothetical protein
MIPILAKFGYDFNESLFRIYIDAGPFVSFLLSATQVTSGTSPVYLDPGAQNDLGIGAVSFDNTQDIKDQLNSTNFGVGVLPTAKTTLVPPWLQFLAGELTWNAPEER